MLIGATSQVRKAQEERAAKQAALPAAKAAAAAQEKAAAALGRRHKPTVLSKELVMAELKRLCEPDEDGDEATTIAALTASIKAFFPHLMAPQDGCRREGRGLHQAARRRQGGRHRSRRRPLLYRLRLSGRRALGVPAAP